MLKCWEENPNDRPTFAKLKTTMKEMERNRGVIICSGNLFFAFILFFYLFACLGFFFLTTGLVTVSKSDRFPL